MASPIFTFLDIEQEWLGQSRILKIQLFLRNFPTNFPFKMSSQTSKTTQNWLRGLLNIEYSNFYLFGISWPFYIHFLVATHTHHSYISLYITTIIISSLSLKDLQVPDLLSWITHGKLSAQIWVWILKWKIPVGRIWINLQVNSWGALLLLLASTNSSAQHIPIPASRKIIMRKPTKWRENV